MILMILVIGTIALAQFQLFIDSLLQRMQVLGLFKLGTTATGCLYSMDTTHSQAGSPWRPAQETWILLVSYFCC
ncbi:hypothetical protein WJX79_010694 [Trebouxia sp. C0005]